MAGRLRLHEERLVKLSVIALDYDGTIARGDVLDHRSAMRLPPPARAASSSCWSPGGFFDELRPVAGSLHVVDGVIAENGARGT